uniref:E3 ubiquitin protein ligase (EC) n=1 Tax=Ganoderma boninense TaxID=34458 RepID=A0A5K1K7X1_9APHY|nr:E3 ubiquitin protein ligase (EC [Ganoderma boninense]
MLETKIGGSLSNEGAASDRVLRELLERSSPRSLKLYVSEFPPLLRDILQPHFSRVTGFKAGISLDNLPDLYEAINVGLPTLNTLEIGMSQHGAELARSLREARSTRPHLLPHLEQSSVPCLHTLVIPGFLFTNSSALPSLTSVDLSNCCCHFCKYRFSPRPDVLLRALARTVNLERLIFQRCLLQYSDFSSAHPTGVPLPQLKYFEGYETPAILQDALESISPPPTASLGVRFWPIGVSRSFHELIPRRADYQALLSTIDEVDIVARFVETRASSLLLRGYSHAGAEPRFSIDMPGRRTMERQGPTSDSDEPLLVIRDLRRLLEPAAVTKLQVHIEDGVPGDAVFRQGEWAVLFDAFPGITSLVVEYRHHCPTGQSLLQPVPSWGRDLRDRECACSISDGWRGLLMALGRPTDPSRVLASPALQQLELWVVHGQTFVDFCALLRETLEYRNEALGRRLAHCVVWLRSGRCHADRNLGQIRRPEPPSEETRAHVEGLLRGLVDGFRVNVDPHGN